MQHYEKPVRTLMREMAESFALQPGQQFTRKQAVDWFTTHYPKVKTGTVTAHLARLSTNAPSRVHYNAKADEDDLFFQVDSGRYRLFDARVDPPPIRAGDAAEQSAITEEEQEETGFLGGDEFAYEKDLQNYLVKNLTVIEPGLTLYEDEGINGVEFPVGGRFIDILAVDSAGAFVVIELKVSKGYDRVVGQLMRYMAWIRDNLGEPGQQVRGIIVARDISQDLLLACSLLEGVELFEYELSLSVKRIDMTAGQM